MHHSCLCYALLKKKRVFLVLPDYRKTCFSYAVCVCKVDFFTFAVYVTIDAAVTTIRPGPCNNQKWPGSLKANPIIPRSGDYITRACINPECRRRDTPP